MGLIQFTIITETQKPQIIVLMFFQLTQGSIIVLDRRIIKNKLSKFVLVLKSRLDTIVFRGGLNQSDVIRSRQYPFYVFSTYIDKRLGYKSAIQFGTEAFFSLYLKEHITFSGIAYPDRQIIGDEDFRRLGIFVGHELFIGKLSELSQVGCYYYHPIKSENKTYLRAVIKRYFGTKWFGVFTVKSHGFSAEAIEYGIGRRF